MCGFKRFRDEEMIDIYRDVLQFILLLTTPVQFQYSGTSESRACHSSFHGQVLWFRKLFLILLIKIPGYPSTNSCKISLSFRPELDYTEELGEELTNRYQQIIGVLRW